MSADSRPGREWTVFAEAPAKLNLGLDVVARRDDGYHDLRTVFQAIDLRDELWFRDSEEPGIHLTVEGSEPVPDGPENLVARAGELLIQRTGADLGAHIKLTKVIPAGTGLGGGSSDAAATLLGLRKLWDLDPEPGALEEMALELGSDVPFFLKGGTALGEGRGERLSDLPGPPPCHWLLVIPRFRISTVIAYQALPQRLTPPDLKTRMLEAALRRGSFESFVENIANDLEVGVVRIQPRLAQIRQELLDRGAAGVGLTGSGSALFAVFKSQGTAKALVDEGFRPGGARLMTCAPVESGARVISRS